MAHFEIKRNDTHPPIQATLSGPGAPLDLTGGSVKFILKSTALSGSAKVNAPATIVSPASGVVKYDWQAADTDTAGNYYAEWEVTLGTGKVVSIPNDKQGLSIRIYEDLG